MKKLLSVLMSVVLGIGLFATTASAGGITYHTGDMNLLNSLLYNSKFSSTPITKSSNELWYVSTRHIRWFPVEPYRIMDITLNDANLTGTVDLSTLAKLNNLNLNDNKSLTNVILPESDYLSNVYLSNTYVGMLDTSKVKNLLRLNLSNTPLATLDLSNNKKLVELNLSGTTVYQLDATNFPDLEKLYLYDTKIGSLDLSKNTKLTILSLKNTKISSINVSKNTELVDLNLSNTNVSAIDVSKNTKLKTLSLSDTKVTQIDTSKNPNLDTLSLSNTGVSSVNVANNTKLKGLYLANTNVSQLDLSNNPDLKYIDIKDSKINSINLTQNTNLTSITGSQYIDSVPFRLVPPAYGKFYITYRNGAYTLTAVPAEGYVFDGWTGLPNFLDESDRLKTELSFSFSDRKLYISGSFSPKPEPTPTPTPKPTPTPGGSGGSGTPGGPTGPSIIPDPMRIKGKTRYETSTMIAQANLALTGKTSYDNIIIANGEAFPDALSGSVLAAKKNAPILMSKKGSNDTDLISYIRKNMKAGGTVYILGGTAAVPESTENAIRGAGYTVKRVKDSDRYGTSMAIIKESGETTLPYIIATGRDYADSLSASSLGFPILLVDGKKDTLSDKQKAFLTENGTGLYYIIGGTGAVSEGIENDLNAYGTVVRIKGKDRYETSVAVAEHFFLEPYGAVLAYGHNFPDGLCGGPLANSLGIPLILTKSTGYTAADNFAQSANLRTAFVLGGASLVSDEAVQDILNTTKPIVVFE